MRVRPVWNSQMASAAWRTAEATTAAITSLVPSGVAAARETSHDIASNVPTTTRGEEMWSPVADSWVPARTGRSNRAAMNGAARPRFDPAP